MRKSIVIAAVVSCIAGAAFAPSRSAKAQSAPGSKSAAAQAKVHAGQEVFQHSCMQCHAVIESQYSFGPNLSGELKKPHPRKTLAEVKEIIKNGKGKMPGFGDKLQSPEMEDLIAYLRTL